MARSPHTGWFRGENLTSRQHMYYNFAFWSHTYPSKSESNQLITRQNDCRCKRWCWFYYNNEWVNLRTKCMPTEVTYKVLRCKLFLFEDSSNTVFTNEKWWNYMLHKTKFSSMKIRTLGLHCSTRRKIQQSLLHTFIHKSHEDIGDFLLSDVPGTDFIRAVPCP